ncbi:Na+/H+ antiporter NhaC [Pseudalkalibacillus caeni]|uniref:Na+/H+ antiporter NhaC n=1 Tax=Exobacillus caeni TaxID=2574798 RepID=A0A5R9EYS0_9BACL|nr:Na+/H+ antiporter NhaC [Pseudalkalibacillus caeni]TLS36317.1 Na+/H+ antiporter NhaC [Pseudalkalibacillus caeni]
MNQGTGSKASFIILFGVIAIIVYTMLVEQVEPHIPLLISLIFTATIATLDGIEWARIEKGMLDGLKVGAKPILILFLVGILIAVWMMSGTVPTLVSYGLSVISPEWFVLSALFITIIVSTFTGSSFTTIGTIGIAMMGMSNMIGINPALAAGAIVSGACFGDKMSPLSDTTNFASGISEVDLFTHIRTLMKTTVPALVLTIIAFLFISHNNGGIVQTNQIDEAIKVLNENFYVSGWTLLSPLLVVLLAFKRFPILGTLTVGALSGVITAWIFQTGITVPAVIQSLQHGFQLDTGNEMVDTMINRGGLQSMMWSISLIMIALSFGGIIREIGVIDKMLNLIIERLSHRGHLISSTALSSIAVNLLTGEQYLSILLPGQTFKPFFEKMKLDNRYLSRTLEDAGTLVNPLVPWGVSGAFFANTLGVPVMEYLPFALFLIFSPLLTVIFGYITFNSNRSIPLANIWIKSSLFTKSKHN